MPGVKATMEEFKAGNLHSGSKQGPKVTNPKQAIAIAMSEERKGKPKPGSKEHRKAHMSKAIKKAHKEYRDKYGEADTNPMNSVRV